MPKGLRVILGLFLALTLIAAACGDDAEETTTTADGVTTTTGGGGETTTTGSTTEGIPDPGTEPNRYPDGTEIIFLGPGGQQDFARAKAAEFSELTNCQVTVEEIAFADILDKVLVSLRTGAYIADVTNIGSQFGGDFMGAGLVYEVPQWAQERSSYDDMLQVYVDLQLYWAGKPYALPWDADLLTYYYRADAFAEFSDEYEALYGHALEPATTWAEYEQIAKFFTEEVEWGGKYGTSELMARDNHGDSGFLTRAAAYAKAPNDKGFFFDLDDMTPRINNPGFVRALEDYIRMLPYGAPEMQNFDWLENATSFLNGDSAQNIQWGDIGPMSHGDISVVQGKVGYAMAPGVDEYWDSEAGAWVQEYNHATFLGFGGWINVVPITAREPQCAMDFAAFMGSHETLAQAVVTGGTGANPGSATTLNPDVWVAAGWDQAEAEAYLGMIQTSLEDPNAVMDLRIPGASEYKSFLEVAMTEAISGQKTAQEALDDCAAEWDRITDSLGREQQLALYRASVGA